MIFPDNPWKCFIILKVGGFPLLFAGGENGDRGQLDTLLDISGLWKGCILGCAYETIEIFLFRWEKHGCSLEEDLREFK